MHIDVHVNVDIVFLRMLHAQATQHTRTSTCLSTSLSMNVCGVKAVNVPGMIAHMY
jgi:hypothetical protein